VDVARAVLAFCASYAASASETTREGKLFRDLAQALAREYAAHLPSRKGKGRVLRQARAWFAEEQSRRRRAGSPGVTFDELYAVAKATVREHDEGNEPGPASSI
jgi:hypothetical protein